MNTLIGHNPSQFAMPTLRTRLRAQWQSASRTLAYGLGCSLIHRPRPRPTAPQRRVLLKFWRDAFNLHRTMLLRPGMRAILRRLESDDWQDFPQFFASLPLDLWWMQQKRRGASSPVTPSDSFPYPAYYLHDFHNQHNGGLSARAASTYEWQIRVLFAGTNRLMRQAAIDAIPQGRGLACLDVGCGTAAWLPQAHLCGRHHEVVGVDLSPHYIARAQSRALACSTFIQCNAEELPANFTNRFDLAVCIWLYHELPTDAQHRVTACLSRALKPGGRLIFMDAAQCADAPDRDLTYFNERFAQDFDEPYFLDYQRLDLERHFLAHQLHVESRQRVFVSNLLTLRKADATSCDSTHC